MKTNLTLLKASAIAFFLFISGSAFSATYYTCVGTTLNLSPSAAPANITYSWDIKKDGAASPGATATAPTSFTDAGSYEVILISTATAGSGICAPDPVSNTIIVLAAPTITLAAPTAAYCEGSGDNTSSIITPTAGGAPSGTDVAYEYSYTVTRGGTTVLLSDVGTVDATTGVLTMTIRTAGEYSITGSVKYKQGASSTIPYLGAGCPTNTASPTTITVTPKPTQPTVTISAT